jgi:FkbM family methyltransferase
MTLLNKLKKAPTYFFKNSYLSKFLFKNQSYSQTGEDLIVRFIFNAIGINSPSYIDIGAHHPYYLNNTAIFYSENCKGINIEPNPFLLNTFKKYRRNDINLNIGIADKEGMMKFYILSDPALSSFSEEEVEKYKIEKGCTVKETVNVEVRTINSVVNEYSGGTFPDFLSIDVEGYDELILQSIDFTVSAPTVICIESISYSRSGRGVKNIAIREFLESKGYLMFADTYINYIFVKKDKWIR